MARIPNRNFLIQFFKDGIKITATDTKSIIRWKIKITTNIKEVYKCYKLKSFFLRFYHHFISFHLLSFISEIQPLEGWGGGGVYSVANKLLGYCVGKRRCWGNNNIFYYIRFLITNLRNK